MKHLKMFGLFVMAAASLMAFAGSASAATFTAPAGTHYTGTLSATLEGSALLKAGFAEITCTEGEVHGEVTGNNETHATGPIDKVHFTKCGESVVTTLNNKGTLTINKSNTEVKFGKCGESIVTTLSSKGTITIHKTTTTVTGTGVEVTVSRFGTSCVYGLGTVTPLGTATNTASGVTLDVKASLGKISGGFLCANPATWTASYIVTVPANSVVD